MAGVLRPLDSGRRAVFLSCTHHGGTLDTSGVLFGNRLSWAHVLRGCASSLAVNLAQLLDKPEMDALEGRRDPRGLIV